MKSVLGRLFVYLKKNPWLLLGNIVCSVLGNVLILYAPTVIGKAVDTIVGENHVQFDVLSTYIIKLALIYLLGCVFIWLSSIFAAAITNRVIYYIREETFSKLMRFPIRFYDRNPHGDILSRFTNDSDALGEGLLQLMNQLFGSVTIVIAAFIFMLNLSPVITLVVVAVMPLVYFTGKTITSKSKTQFSKQQALIGELNGFAEEQIKGQRLIRAFHSEADSLARFESINERLYTVGYKAQFLSALGNPSTRFVNYIAYILTAVVGGAMATYYGYSIGVIASFVSYSTLFSRPFQEMTAILTQLLSGIAAAKRIFSIMDTEEESEEPKRPAPTESIKGEIEFRNVSFAYNPDRPLIKNLNLKVEAGMNIAIVGGTGAGKTTLVNLLMRFYDITDGEIVLDGINIKEYDRSQLRRCFAMVLQDTWLFGSSVADNIAYGRPNASMEEIKATAKAVGAHGFIRRLQDGYDTIVDENGENLSLGQKQLITIARAMLLNPPILILDEATSSVDTLTEQKIQKAFQNIMKGRTSFVIAHRLSTIRKADLILVMDKGDIVEQGTHSTLLKQNGYYAKLYYSQFES